MERRTRRPRPDQRRRRAFRESCLYAALSVSWLTGSAAAAPDDADASATGSPNAPLQEVTVTAKRLDLLGTAATASEGVVTDQELQLTPGYRPGQLLETVPGLIVTLHSGEGKANQYLLRGYNLDHGTDLETYVDGMPINQPTHAHGQGYTDLNFMIPELADGITLHQGALLRRRRRLRRGRLGACRAIATRFPIRSRPPPARSVSAHLRRRLDGRSADGNLLARRGSAALRRPLRRRPMMRARRTACCATAKAMSTTATR